MSQTDFSDRVAHGLARIGLALRHSAWQEGRPHGVTPTQAQVLAALGARCDTPLGLTDVARELAVTAATASDAVGALVSKGFVTRIRSAADGRAIALRLTRRGLRAARELAGQPEFLLQAIDELPPQDQPVLLRCLVSIVRSLQERGQIHVARMCVACRFFRPHVYHDSAKPHHCGFADAPFGDRDLGLNCPHHQRLERAEDRARLWQSYVRPPQAARDVREQTSNRRDPSSTSGRRRLAGRAVGSHKTRSSDLTRPVSNPPL